MEAVYTLIALALFLVPSPIPALLDRWRGRSAPVTLPPSDEEGGRRAYGAFVRAQVEPADVYPSYDQLPAKSQGIWRQVFRAAYGLPLLLCLLFCVGACGAAQRTPKHDLAAAVESNAADLDRFGEWDRQKQLKIRARCEAQHVGEVECDKRLAGYRETRDALHALLKRQVMTLDGALQLLGAEEGR